MRFEWAFGRAAVVSRRGAFGQRPPPSFDEEDVDEGHFPDQEDRQKNEVSDAPVYVRTYLRQCEPPRFCSARASLLVRQTRGLGPIGSPPQLCVRVAVGGRGASLQNYSIQAAGLFRNDCAAVFSAPDVLRRLAKQKTWRLLLGVGCRGISWHHLKGLPFEFV